MWEIKKQNKEKHITKGNGTWELIYRTQLTREVGGVYVGRGGITSVQCVVLKHCEWNPKSLILPVP